jgi:hypothetical protein
MRNQSLSDTPKAGVCSVRDRLLILRSELANTLARCTSDLVDAAVTERNAAKFSRLRAKCAALLALMKETSDEMNFHRSQHHC